MEIANLDKRKKTDIIKYINDISHSYTPEWKFDEQSPDIGSALALVYANIFSSTINKFNRVLEKNKISFFNSIGATMLPAVPSKGYVSFSLVAEDVPGSEVETGTRVVSNNGEEDIYFETTDDVYATPALLYDVYQANDKIDIINHIFDIENPSSFKVFNEGGKNIQEHVFYIGSRQALNIKNDSMVELTFYANESVSISEHSINALVNKDCAVFEYKTIEGEYIEFDNIYTNGESIILSKGKDQPEFGYGYLEEDEEFEGVQDEEELKNYWIRLRVKDISLLDKFTLTKVGIRPRSMNILPDVIQAGGIESNVDEFFAFGEKFALYSEVYFGSDEVICKRGSTIKLSFNMDFIRVPMDLQEPQEIDWKWIMKRADFQIEPEYDAIIEEVIWEYYNGKGWTRLFKDNSYNESFTPKGGTIGQFRELVFECPKDIQSTAVGAHDTFYVRARILKASNLYKARGYFISPLLSNVALSYNYEKNDVVPDLLYIKNNVEENFITSEEIKKDEVIFYPFKQIGTDVFSLYFGFKYPPIGSPIKMFFELKENINNSGANLEWSYYDGSRFKELNSVDETDNFSKSGILTFIGNKDMKKLKLFGKDRYWIRVSDRDNFFFNKIDKTHLPIIDSIYMNTVGIVNVDFSGNEVFRIDKYEGKQTFKLLNKKLRNVEVWIDEVSTLSQDEIKILDKEDKINLEYDDSKVLKSAWVKWEEVEDIIFSSADDRVYMVDRNEGVVTFGDGVMGRIPPVGRSENLKIIYSSGGGEGSNIDINKIERIERSIGYISEAHNYDMILGGCDKESLKSAIARNAASLKNKYKAVTSKDFEELAMMVSTNIKRTKCFAGINEFGERSPGTVTLIVLQKDHERGKNLFGDMKSKIYNLLEDKIPGNLSVIGKFNIVEPTFVSINLKVELTVKDFNLIFKVKKRVLDRLEKFLDPIYGHFDDNGWDIGDLPTDIQIRNIVKEIKDVVYVKNVYATAFVDDVFGKVEADMDKIRKNKFVLPINGEHEIVISVE